MATSDGSVQDLSLILKHLAALRDEVRALREEVASTAQLAREAALQEVVTLLQPSIACLVAAASRPESRAATRLTEELTQALVQLGLESTHRPGDILELWPEEAVESFALDQPLPPHTGLVRVEVLASGWRRRSVQVVPTPARVLETVDPTCGSDPALPQKP